jgi:hypothetical protein
MTETPSVSPSGIPEEEHHEDKAIPDVVDMSSRQPHFPPSGEHTHFSGKPEEQYHEDKVMSEKSDMAPSLADQHETGIPTDVDSDAGHQQGDLRVSCSKAQRL